jgi:LppP/LprE lipoprotein
MRFALVVALGGLLAVGGSAAASTSEANLAAAKAYVSHHCQPGSRRSASLWQTGWNFNALYGDCGGGDGHDQRIWFFTGSRFVGTDAPNSSAEIIGVWRDGDTLAFLYVLYRRSDSLCCPTGGGEIVRFHWTGNRLARLDPLPARTPSRAHPSARYP